MNSKLISFFSVMILLSYGLAGCINQPDETLESDISGLQIENKNLNDEISDLSLMLNNSNLSITELNDEISDLSLMLNNSNLSIIEQNYTPLFITTYNSSDVYMDHANGHGDLLDRVTFDESGIPMVQYYFGLHYAPSTAFHWGLVSYSKWVTSGNISNFNQAKQIADWAVENQSEDGGWGWFFNHNFSRGSLGELQSGWYSAMTQGLGMSFLSRMYDATGNNDYKKASLNATKLFEIPVEDGGVLTMYDSMPWYEEYPTPDAGSFVLNGFIYSLIGLYDSWKLLNDTNAMDKYNTGINSLKNMISLFDLGCFSSYDLVHHAINSKAPNIAREFYHGLHITQLSLLNLLESDVFLEIQERWIGYANNICSPHN